jgi:hypothetical protein
MRITAVKSVFCIGILSVATLAHAEEPITAELAYYSLDNIVLLVCAILVLFMQAGLYESFEQHRQHNV